MRTILIVLGIWLLINVLFVVIMLPPRKPRKPDPQEAGTLAPARIDQNGYPFEESGEGPASPCGHLDRHGDVLLACAALDGSDRRHQALHREASRLVSRANCARRPTMEPQTAQLLLRFAARKLLISDTLPSR
ncbi:hypothetical protein ACVWXN_003687 [Bradyrhizobium sp. i1.4.4]